MVSIQQVGRFLIALIGLYFAMTPLWVIISGAFFGVLGIFPLYLDLVLLALILLAVIALAVVFVRNGYSIEHLAVFDFILLIGLALSAILGAVALSPFQSRNVLYYSLATVMYLSIYGIAYFVVYREGYDNLKAIFVR